MRSTERQYITSYMCFIQTLVIRCTVYEMQPLENYVTLISPLRVIQGQRSWGKLKDHILLPMCFIETLVITCTVSDILAWIDHKLDLSGLAKMTLNGVDLMFFLTVMSSIYFITLCILYLLCTVLSYGPLVSTIQIFNLI